MNIYFMAIQQEKYSFSKQIDYTSACLLFNIYNDEI